jgi:N-acetylmuramoyl-L-alanine amidase
MDMLTARVKPSKAFKKGIFPVFLILVFFIPLTSFIPKLFPFGIKKVVIDAGHGGHDPGCLGAKSKEKEVALGISLKLGKYIEENLKDVEVIYTRKTDKFVALHERASIANKNKADLFICIHCNSGVSTAYGAETYVMGLHKTKENLSVAKRENSAILMEQNYEKEYGGFDPNSDEANIMFALYQSAFLDNSLNFAAKVQKQFKEKVGRHDRGVKQAGFLVLYMTTMPSVLIETGFLTNRNDENFLATAEGQDLMAKAIFTAFKEYKFEKEGRIIEQEEPKIITVSDKKDTGIIQKKEAPVLEKVDNTAIEKKESIAVKNTVNSNVSKEIAPPEKIEKVEEVKDTGASRQGVFYKVQITTSVQPVKLVPQNFKGLENVSSYQESNLIKYTVGEERTLGAAKKIMDMAREKGYKDAFIIAFKDGKKIPISEAAKDKGN